MKIEFYNDGDIVESNEIEDLMNVNIGEFVTLNSNLYKITNKNWVIEKDGRFKNIKKIQFEIELED